MPIKNSKQSRRSPLLVGIACLLLLWRTFFADHETYVLKYFRPPNTTGTTTRDYDYTLGPAVARAKYLGFRNRKSNSGHNRSDLEALTADKCEEQGAAEFLPFEEIQRRKLPMAILIGVQKGGTTALYSYLRQHPGIENMEKELNFLDEVLDYYLLNATHPSIPRNRGRELYSQATLGITSRWRRAKNNAKKNARHPSRRASYEDMQQMFKNRAPRKEYKKRTQRRKGKGKGHQKENRDIPEWQTEKQSHNTEGEDRDVYMQHERRRHLEDEEDEQEFENRMQDQRNNEYMAQSNSNENARSPSRRTHPSPDEDMQRMFKNRAPRKEYKKGTISIAVDMTPNYMLHSDRVPARIQCLVPWVKLFVILRHPIDRARSQYDMKVDSVVMRVFKESPANQNSHGKLVNKWGTPIPSFDQFVRDDLDALYELGVLQDWTKVKFEKFWKSEQCWKAWQKYIHSGLNAPVGMGLYALQLKPFLDVLQSMHGVNATDYFFAIDNQKLRNRPDETFQDVLKFLELAPFSLKNYARINQASGGKTAIKKPTRELSPETLRLVQVAIEPYNQKLADLLGAEWRDKWSS